VPTSVIESGPIPAIHGVVRWRLIDLAQWVCEEYRIRVAKKDFEAAVADDGLPQALGPAGASRLPAISTSGKYFLAAGPIRSAPS
jgi:hypothetical protein